MLEFFGIGAVGGIVRELVSHAREPPKNKQEWINIVWSLVSAAIIGGFVGLLVDQTLVLAGTAGYLGSDAIDNLIALKRVKKK